MMGCHDMRHILSASVSPMALIFTDSLSTGSQINPVGQGAVR
jgi:hypothetical protein